ncbi:MAG: SNF2/helicase domain protein [Myxococcaceae bacterium]|nr:SNF2/helicase domain protein [Myxococcaceae bacterium]
MTSIPDLLPRDDGTWLRTLKAEVQPITFKTGREYAEGRRVSNLARTPDGLAARVTGTEGEKYEVSLKPSVGKILSACSCQSWNKFGPHCKHVVAVGLVYLARLRSAADTEVLPGTVTEAPPAAEEPVDELPEATAEVVSLPALAKLESWIGLSALPDYEFIYRIAPIVLGTSGRQWVLDVRRLDQQAKGPIHVKRTLSGASRIAPADELVFLELARFEPRYDSKMVVADEDLANLLDLLKARKVIYRGTALVFGEEPARPVIRLENKTDGATARIDIQLPDGTTLLLKDVALMSGRRSWVLAGQQALVLEPDFPSRILRKWMLEPSMVFPPSQLDRVLSFFAAHLPRFRMSLLADGLEVDDKCEPKFVLTLEGTAERVKAQLAGRYGTNVTVPVSPTAQHLGYASGGTGNERKLYLRQEAQERAAGKLLTELGFRFDQTNLAYEAAGDAALDFWAHRRATLPKAWEQFAAAAPRVRVRPKVKPRVRVNMSGVNWFELDADFVTDDQSVDLGAVRMWLDSGRRFIALKDGTFAEADLAELRTAADLLEEAGAAPGKKKTKLPLFHAPALDLLAALGEVEIDAKARKAMAELKEIDGIPAVKAPAKLQATLRNYQEAGLAWLWFLHRHGLSGVLADDMGLGKTVQALCLLLKTKDEFGSAPTLVVAPTSVLANWEREIEKFTPGLTCVTWHGQDRHEKAEQLHGVDVVLTSYALIRRDVEELKKVKWRTVVLDEAQNIKNADSATAQACKAIEADTRLALTGTPLENRLTELWSLFDFLMPGFLGTADAFHDRFEHPIMIQADMTVRDRLKKRIHPFILRRLKTEVAKDLPPKTETVAWCEMEPGQAALYQEVLEESRRKVFDTIEKVGFNRSRVSILAALMKLRQVCCDPRLLKLPPGTSLPPSAKLSRFGDLVDDLVAEGHRALVFSQFTEMLEILTRTADEKGLKYMYLDGRTKDRMARVDTFNAPDGPPLFFISLKAGGTGLNLVAADYVIHYDPWWNPAVEDQATDRTHRIGQTRAVFSYKLITRGTVEEKILALQQRKRELAAGVLGTDSDVGKALTERDVEDLFRPQG